MSTHSSPVVDMFYGLSEVAEDVHDNPSGWLAALVLLLAEELDDRDRVVALAREALHSVAPKNDDEEEKSWI